MRIHLMALAILCMTLLLLTGCSVVKTTGLGVRWLDWTELSKLRFGQSVNEVTVICGEPLFSEHNGNERMFSLYYRYKLRFYVTKKIETQDNYTIRTLIKAEGEPQSYSEKELTFRMNFVYDVTKHEYTLYDWVIVGPDANGEKPIYRLQ